MNPSSGASNCKRLASQEAPSSTEPKPLEGALAFCRIFAQDIKGHRHTALQEERMGLVHTPTCNRVVPAEAHKNMKIVGCPLESPYVLAGGLNNWQDPPAHHDSSSDYKVLLICLCTLQNTSEYSCAAFALPTMIQNPVTGTGTGTASRRHQSYVASSKAQGAKGMPERKDIQYSTTLTGIG